MLAGDLRVRGDALGLEPQDELHAQLCVHSIAHRLQAVGETVRLGEPVAHAVGKRLGEPRGVEPIGVAADLVRSTWTDCNCVGLGRPRRSGVIEK